MAPQMIIVFGCLCSSLFVTGTAKFTYREFIVAQRAAEGITEPPPKTVQFQFGTIKHLIPALNEQIAELHKQAVGDSSFRRRQTYTRADYCAQLAIDFESGSISPYTSLGTNGVQTVNRGPNDDPATAAIENSRLLSRQTTPLANQRAFYTNSNRLGNRVSGVLPNAGSVPGGATAYGGIYIHAGEYGVMQVSFDAFLQDEPISFVYYKTAVSLNFQACCGDLNNCPVDINDQNNQFPADPRIWHQGSVTCPAGTEVLIFVCESVNAKDYQGACAVDNVVCATPFVARSSDLSKPPQPDYTDFVQPPPTQPSAVAVDYNCAPGVPNHPECNSAGAGRRN